MNEYNEVMQSITELRKTLDTRLDDCITREKAEKLAEDAVRRIAPERKAVLPDTETAIMERAESFKKSARNTPERPWNSEYGRKFGNMRNFLLAAKNRLAITGEGKSVLAEGTSSAGGYLVPTEFSAQVVRLMQDSSELISHSNVIPMSSWKRQIPKQISNVSVGWAIESAARTATAPSFGQIEQVAKVMAAVIKCTDELIRDSAINLTEFLSELVAEAMALEIERVALAGSTVAGDPFNGILYASGVNSVSMGSTSVSFDDIADLVFSLSDAYARDGVIALSRTGLKKLIKLKDTQGSYIWQPPAGDMPATLWNTPYIICSQIPSDLGDNSDLTAAIFGRFNRYMLISPRQELEIKVSQDASDWDNSALQSAFMQDQTWLRFTQAMSIDVAHGAAFSCLKFK
ncbi:MAG: phage major capsid protein [Elusimicrobiaceae bacterium]|nr:phage major capsid protein [Elusimicrobiaceae bacterium]